MSNLPHIFHDPSGRRRFFARLLVVTTIITITALTFYAYRLFHKIPVMLVPAELQDTARQLQKEKHTKINQTILNSSLQELEQEIKNTTKISRRQGAIAAPHDAAQRIWTIYEPGNENSYYAFRFNVEKITDVILPVLNLSETGLSFEELDLTRAARSQIKETTNLAKNYNIKIFARLINESPSGFSPSAVLELTKANDEQLTTLIENLIKTLKEKNLNGLVIDFRNITPETYFQLVPFFSELRRIWDEQAQGIELGINFPASDQELPLWKFGTIFDVALMHAIRQSHELSKPGPVSATNWFIDAMQLAIKNIPLSKLAILFDNTASDWVRPSASDAALQNNEPREAQITQRSFLSALTLARDIAQNSQQKAQDLVQFDPISMNSFFSYIGPDNQVHQVWFSDAINSFNQYSLAQRAGLKQFGTSSLGLEDPGVWTFLAENPKFYDSRQQLKQIEFPFGIQFEGRGDILKPTGQLRAGSRSVKFDKKNGLITASHYKNFPAAVIVSREAFKPKTIALTFDDGPSEPLTTKILDLLQKEKIKATFFVSGQRVQEEPDLLRRIYRSGHDLGNSSFSHPDLALVSRQRQLLELNSTQRLIQSIIERSPILFRPPYFSEGSPAALREVKVLNEAKKLNYLTVGVALDPQDWKLEKRDQFGEEVERTAPDLANEILDRVTNLEGNTILFHDGEKEVDLTLQTLEIIIPELRRRGFKFASISELLEIDRESLHPKVSEQELAVGGLSRIYIEFLYYFRSALEIIFILVAAFGVLRLLSFIAMSIWSVKHEDVFNAQKNYETPPVSILIAAYNEEKVIERTIRSLLAANYPEFEIIVIDDGSKDGTSDVVAKIFGQEEKVKLIRKENGGKSSALNVGLQHAKFDIVVGLDADTQYAPDAIAAMARHFSDPKIAAVAGNVKVGNRNSLLLQCQSIEYITNQNFGRRAFSVVDAIMVVPGAAGAWRKSAVDEVGGYLSDTLGEDMELTWRVRMAGYKIAFEPRAYAFTEAPTTLAGVFNQRFRWIYGQIQILWKHRSAFFNSDYKWFGWFGAPLTLLDNIFLVIAPLADLQALIALWGFIIFLLTSSEMSAEALANYAPLSLFLKSMLVYLIFFGTEVLCGIYAFRLDREPLRPLWLIFVKQFFYRQLMYIVCYKALWRALIGWKQNWGVLHRTGTVNSNPLGKNVVDDPEIRN